MSLLLASLPFIPLSNLTLFELKERIRTPPYCFRLCYVSGHATYRHVFSDNVPAVDPDILSHTPSYVPKYTHAHTRIRRGASDAFNGEKSYAFMSERIHTPRGEVTRCWMIASCCIVDRRAARGGRKDYKDKGVSEDEGQSSEDDDSSVNSEFEVLYQQQPASSRLVCVACAVCRVFRLFPGLQVLWVGFMCLLIVRLECFVCWTLSSDLCWAPS